jgi:serine protease AprX
VKRLLFPLLLLCLCAGILLAEGDLGAPSVQAKGGRDVSKEAKLSAGLRTRTDERVGVVIQLNRKPAGALNALLHGSGVHVRAELKSLNVVTVELPASMVERLAAFEEVEFVSADSAVASFGHVSATPDADSVRTQTTRTLLGTTTTTLDGSGIGIAVVDSGVEANYTSFLDKSNGVRVVKSVDFTGEGITSDPYGHGTHGAAAAAGNGRISNAAYTGVAPNENIINLRVLNRKGVGTTAALLSALD